MKEQLNAEDFGCSKKDFARAVRKAKAEQKRRKASKAARQMRKQNRKRGE